MPNGPYRKLIRYVVKPEHLDENRVLVGALVNELRVLQPPEFSYLTMEIACADFLHLAIIDSADGSHPLHQLESFKAWAQDLNARCLSGPDFAEPDFLLSCGLGVRDLAQFDNNGID